MKVNEKGDNPKGTDITHLQKPKHR